MAPDTSAPALAAEPHRVEKPWGHELIYAHTSRYAGKILHIEPHQALSLQYHERKEESIHVLRGLLVFEVEEGGEMRRLELPPGQGYHIRPRQKHRMSAGAEACELLEVSTPELEDVVRLEDRYGRIPGERPPGA